ncbi:MAG: quinolinate synthase NadA [Deltaproteobacteria bacterium]|nr:quinolinate synthase NadA [Deltaproteobacteria bacterium]
MDKNKLLKKIRDIKEKLGDSLIILTHHYQNMDIVDLGDYKGDSFDLSQKAAKDRNARYIVFCGVHFMAESAAILAQSNQIVQIPDYEAGCWMAEMADINLVNTAWQELHRVIGGDQIIPVVYMNSDAELKAFCGRQGGIVCTSSNAGAAIDWGFSRGDKILFFPDQHLGRNTGNRMGIKPEEMILWSPGKVLGGNSPETVKKSRIILWDGYCLVHTRFGVEHIKKMKEKYPDATTVVHPECTQELVAAADAVGSTSFIVKYVDQAPPGSTILVGTEINLIERLNRDYTDRDVLPLYNSPCPNMHKITPEKLLNSLENIGSINVVEVPEEIKTDARKALDRMLELPS